MVEETENHWDQERSCSTTMWRSPSVSYNYVGVDGVRKMTGHDTNENRGYNQAGYANNLTMNTGHINRQKAADSG